MTGKLLTVIATVALTGVTSAARAEDPAIFGSPAEIVGPALPSLASKRIVFSGVDASLRC